MWAQILLLFLGIFATGRASPAAPAETVTHYDGYQVLTLTLFSREEISLLEKWQSQVQLDIWKDLQKITTGKAREIWETDIMISPQDFPAAKHFLEENNLTFRTKIQNVQQLIQTEALEMAASLTKGIQGIDWASYYRYDQIVQWVSDIVTIRSDIATVEVIGNSTDGRPLQLVKISKPGSAPNKNAIFIDGGFHAREWISPAIATYIINDLLTNTDANADVLDLVDVYIVPVINPDGYEWSHTNARMWRRTRSDHSSPLGCKGVDANRNLDFHFGGPGTSDNKCSDIYRGPHAFSEPEIAALRDVLHRNGVVFQAYFTLHSYGQMWLSPWSFRDARPEDYDDLMRFANHGVAAIAAVHGTKFRAGATSDIYGMASGCADDYAKGAAGIKYAYTLEVRDTGRYGFVLPANQIIPTAEETWAGIRAVAKYDFDNHRPRP